MIKIVLDSIQVKEMSYDLYDIKGTCGTGVARLLDTLRSLDQGSAVEITIKALDDEEAEESVDYHSDYADNEEETEIAA